MRAHVSRWGNSLAIRIPKPLAKDAGLSDGTQVEMRLSKRMLTVVAARPEYRLERLVAKITPRNRHAEYDWAPRPGRKCGESPLRSAARRSHLAELRSAGRPRAGRQKARAGALPFDLQSKGQPRTSVSGDHAGQGLSIRGGAARGVAIVRRDPSGSREERRLGCPERRVRGQGPGRRPRRSHCEAPPAARFVAHSPMASAGYFFSNQDGSFDSVG
jgi:antitoxin MazE